MTRSKFKIAWRKGSDQVLLDMVNHKTFKGFCEYIGSLCLHRKEKNDAPYFIRGGGIPERYRNDKNLKSADLLVLDVDSKQFKNPKPNLVHKFLVACKLTHFIYTTTSHSAKHPSYRVVLPYNTKSRSECQRATAYLLKILKPAEIQVDPVSFVWSQRWYASSARRTKFYSHDGESISIPDDFTYDPKKKNKSVAGVTDGMSIKEINEQSGEGHEHTPSRALAMKFANWNIPIEEASALLSKYPEHHDGHHQQSLETAYAKVEAEKKHEDHLPVYQCIKDILAVPISWLWPDRIAKGKPTVVAGNPGLGKSQITINMAATISNGGTWPDGTKCEIGNIIILSTEDDAADTIRPRLEAADADLNRVFILQAVKNNDALSTFNFKNDLPLLEAMIEKIGGAAAIFIDPFSAYLENVDTHKDSEIRGVFGPISDLASKHNTAFICIAHLNKKSGAEAMLRVGGSIAIVAASRAAYLVVQDGERRVFIPLKNNLGNDRDGFEYIIESVDLGNNIKTSRIKWLEEIKDISANNVLQSDNSSESSALSEAKVFLTELLTDNPLPAKDAYKESREAGHAKRTVDRAKRSLNIKSKKDADKWVWKLPEKSRLPLPPRGNVGNVGVLGNVDKVANTAKGAKNTTKGTGNVENIRGKKCK